MTIGQSIPRLEDRRFLTGQGCFTDDLRFADALFACVVRSPHAHARIERIDTAAARAMPGVAAVLTGADVLADGLGLLKGIVPLPGAIEPPRRPLAIDRARHAGDPVALVVADTLARARDAAERVDVDWTPLPAVVDAAGALSAGAPVLWDEAPGNHCVVWRQGDAVAVDAAFAGAAHVISLTVRNNRLVGNAIEPRVAIGGWDAANDRAVLHTTSQGVHLIRQLLCDDVFGWPHDRLRVVTPDVGGGFGPKFFLYPEQALVVWAARRLQRTVRWTSDRSEAFLSDTHARDQTATAELALDADGRFLAIRAEVVANLGAYVSTFGLGVPTDGMAKVLTGCYGIPAAQLTVTCAFSNTVPVDAYRGAGKPEALFLLERLIDVAARATGHDPTDLRRRNLIPAAAMPYRTALGKVYDSGDFPAALEQALALAERDGFAARRAQAATAGRLRGFGVACYLHGTGGIADETSEVEAGGDADAGITVRVGAQSSGQGHATVFAQIVAQRLGLPVDSIHVVQGDTHTIARGGGTGGSSSTIISGNTVARASDDLIEQGRERAADRLEAAQADIDYAQGRFHVVGTDRGVSLFELAAASRLAGSAAFQDSMLSFPAGAQAAEVEIDPQTGSVTLVALASSVDVGPPVNPMLVAGQMHGGLTQGIGQALMEHAVHDPATGQLVAGSLMDYALPRAADLPAFRHGTVETASPNNTLGFKGVGELGPIGAPPAVVNAIADALADAGVTHLDMPVTAETVWRALRGGLGGESA
jgi:aerobic carbon-monoxide dehydrogenase large subunit